MRNNKKGFTLIEIIVSIMIASIGMIIATTLILNSMGYFNKTTVADHDKQAVDGIKDYVQDELMYATEIRVVSSSKAPEGEWYWLYIKDGRLYRGDYTDETKETEVYGTDFYNRRTLKMTAKKFKVNRIDLSFAFLDDKASTIYKTKTTIELLNTELKSDSDLSLQYLNTEDVNLLTESNYRIYYKKGSLPINEVEDNGEEDEPDVERDGTVRDEINCIEGSDFDKGKWQSGVTYKKGDYVYLEKDGKKTYYKSESDYNVYEPGSTGVYTWKPLTAEWQAHIWYETGDIIYYNGLYYQFLETGAGAGQPPDPTGAEHSWSKGYVTVEALLAERNVIPNYFKCPIENGTVEDSFKEVDLTKAEQWVRKYYNKGDIVFLRNGVGFNDFKYYIAIDNGSMANPLDASPQNTIWKCLDSKFDNHSKYQIGDIIYVMENGKKTYYKVKANSPDAYPPGNYKDPLKDKSGWQKVEKDSNGNWVNAN